MKRIIRYIPLIIAFITVCTHLHAFAGQQTADGIVALQPPSPQEAVDAFVRNRAIDSTRVAVMIRDLRSGVTIGSYNPGTPLIPASIQKALTTATLLRIAGKDFRYNTDVFIDNEVGRDNILDGNIIVKASGDPTLNSSKLPLTPDFVADIVSAVRKKGIDSISGRIIVDQSLFAGPAIPPSWAQGDLRHSYGTGCHAFNFQNNASGKSAIQNPASVFISRLGNALASASVKLGNNETSGKKHLLIHRHKSASADEIMRSCMMRSDNLYAEAMLQTIPVVKGEKSSLEKAIDIERDYWRRKKADLGGVAIADGSGLSRSNRMTAEFMSDLLAEMSPDPYYASFFPLAGREGTLKNLLAGTELEEYVAMKTGSMSGIQCYAGYKLDDNYAPTHSIVIMVNNMRGARSEVRRAVEKMLLAVFPQP